MTPSAMLEPPAKAVCPPPLTVKGARNPVRVLMATETSLVVRGVTKQPGWTSAWRTDQ